MLCQLCPAAGSEDMVTSHWPLSVCSWPSRLGSLELIGKCTLSSPGGSCDMLLGKERGMRWPPAWGLVPGESPPGGVPGVSEQWSKRSWLFSSQRLSRVTIAFTRGVLSIANL